MTLAEYTELRLPFKTPYTPSLEFDSNLKAAGRSSVIKALRASTGIFSVAIVLLFGLFSVYRYRLLQQSVVHDYVLPGDNFDKKTMEAIQADLTQYNVESTQQDHEVYMVTGGLGIANPRVLSWDSAGNMTFAGNQGDGWFYTFQETAQSPADWYTQIQGKGVMWTNGPQPGFKPVPWVLKHTRSGVPYYEWDTIQNQTTQFYFKRGNTYIVLKDDYTSQSPPKFPDGLVSHLVSVGNPVKHK